MDLDVQICTLDELDMLVHDQALLLDRGSSEATELLRVRAWELHNIALNSAKLEEERTAAERALRIRLIRRLEDIRDILNHPAEKLW